MTPFRLVTLSILLLLPLNAVAIEVGGTDYGPDLDEDDLGDICRTAEDYDRRHDLGAALEWAEVSVGFTAEAYSPTENLLTGHVSYRAGAYVSDYVLNIDTTKSGVPEGMGKGDRLRVIGHMKANEFFANLIESCFVEVLATDVIMDGF